MKELKNIKTVTDRFTGSGKMQIEMIAFMKRYYSTRYFDVTIEDFSPPSNKSYNFTVTGTRETVNLCHAFCDGWRLCAYELRKPSFVKE